MQNELNFTTLDHPSLRTQANPILEAQGISIKEVATSNLEDILGGKTQAALVPLNQLSVPIQEGLTISALLARPSFAIKLYISPKDKDDTQLLGIAKGSTIFCSNELEKVQLLDFRPDLKAAIGTPKEDYSFLAMTSDSTWTFYEFNPVEFIPAPGQGTLAAVAATSDKTTRRLLKKVHQAEIARRTNIERQIQLLAPTLHERLGAHCEIDASGNYHLHAVLIKGNTPKYAKASASSHLGLVEKVLAGLSND